MDNKALDLMVCPLCKGELLFYRQDNELVCRFDRLAFPIEDGVPKMLVEEARELPADEEIKE